MNISRRYSGTFRTFFWTLFALSMAMLAINQGLACGRELTAITEKWDSQESEDAAAFSGRIDSCLVNISVVAARLQKTAWVQKLFYDTPSFQSEFSWKRKREITQDSMFYQPESSMLSTIFILFPYRDICITQGAWVDIASYLQEEYPHCDDEAILGEIMSLQSFDVLCDIDSQSLLFCIPIDKSSSPRAYMCCKARIPRWRNTLENERPSTIAGMRVVENDTGLAVFETGRIDEGGAADLALPSRLDDWSYEIYVDRSLREASEKSAYFSFACTVLLLTPCALLASLLFAGMLYRPLNQLLRHLKIDGATAEAKGTDFQCIGNFCDQMVGEYQALMREHCCAKLLYGRFCAQDEPRCNGLCFDDNMFFQAFLISGEENVSEEVGRFVAFCKRSDLLHDADWAFTEAPNNHMALVVAFPTEELARLRSPALAEALKNHFHITFEGSVRRGLRGIAFSWAHALEAQRRLCLDAQRFYPLDWKIRLLRALQSRDADACAVLRCLRAENDQRVQSGAIGDVEYHRLLAELVDDIALVVTDARPEQLPSLETLRDALEGENAFCALAAAPGGAPEPRVHSDGPPETRGWNVSSYASVWRELERVADRICEGDPQEDLLKYLHENCCDASLDLNTLADAFHVSVSTLGKRIKELTGKTFLSYITSLRMERACMLLTQNGLPIASIAQLCGYGSDVSFRRAFIRCVGMRPQEYRDQPNV